MYNDIANLIFKFANCFDLKNWKALEEILVDQIECDYQTLRGEIKICSKIEYVRERKVALNDLRTQHLF